MTEETIVAVYDTAAHADAAVRDLEAANVPAGAISVHAESETASTSGMAAPAKEPGFWASMFGGESSDSATFARSVESGATVVTVKVPEQHFSRVSDILERHNPIDVDERTASYGTIDTTRTTTTTAPVAASGTAPSQLAPQAGSDTIQLAEERLSIGKRAVNRGTTRIRRYTVETPVEEQVTLRDETVHVDRHAVTDGRAVTDADFAERTIEMHEVDEEAVVGKTVRVVEEISLRKETVDRVETVHDTVRREEVEIEELPDSEAAPTRTAANGPASPTRPAKA